MTARNLAKRIAQSMLSKKGADIVIIDIRGLSSAADYFVVCTADSDVQVRAIADVVERDSKLEGEYPWHTEGLRGGVWVIQDYVDAVAHIFHKDARTFYNLERLWADAKITHVREAPARKAVVKPRKSTTGTKQKSA